jgi:YD repeat-containing protein
MKNIFLIFIGLLLNNISIAQSNQIQYHYDNLNQLTKVEQSNGITIEYFYDELGNRIGKTITVVPNYDVYFTRTPTIPQDTVTAGDVITIASIIGNRGNTATHSAIDFYWSLDTLKDGSDVALASNKAITKTIAVNESVKDSFLVTLPSSLVNSGGFILCVLDDNDNLSELDENNNIEVIALNIIVLPVELLSFTGEKAENGNLLEWITASELNNKGFDVERSENGENFEKIGFVEGNGTTLEIQNYDYLDENVISELTYYRLKQIDFDGQFEYSNVVVIYQSIKKETVKVSFYPNPTRENQITTLEFDNILSKDLIYRIVGVDGKILEVGVLSKNELKHQIKVPQVVGTYYLQLFSENQQIKVIPFLVQ